MTGLLRRLRAAFRKRPPAAGPSMATAGGTGHGRAAKRRRPRRPVTLQEAGAARLEALVAARFDALDAAMAARAQAQLVTLARLIGEAIVAECRGVRAAVAAGRAAGQGTPAEPRRAGAGKAPAGPA